MPLRTPLRSSPRSAPRSSRKAGARLARACGSPVEALERRQLLTAIINGLFVETNSPIFEYEQADGTSIRISVEGNLTAEFIGARVPEESTTLIIRDLVPAGFDGDGVNLFSIYIVEADENTTISIAQVPDPNTPERPMQPFQSNAGELNAVDATTGVRLEDLDTGNSTGAVFIGARTDSSVAIFDNIPLIQTPRRRFGLRPSSAGQLFPGIEVAPGNDVGRILIGGTITGLVDIPGNCQFFYAGNILTGDPEGTGFTIPRNFYVGGDLGNLTVSGSIGTITLLQDGERDLQNIVYNTGADLYVGGRLGQFKALDSSLANITVANRASVRGSGLSQEEIEFRGPELEGSASYFDPVIGPGRAHLGEQDLTQGAAAPASSYFNDSFDSAQYLGTLFSTELNANEVIQLRGTLVAAPVIEDNVDYYAVALLGGQTAQVQLLQTPQASIGVFDPDGRLIATDYDNLNFTNRWNKPFRFNADRPGAYRIAIANRGDVNYNGSLDAGESWSRLSPDNYELRVSKAADIALGGLIVNNHIATYGSAAINVERGDLGAVRAGVLGTGTIWTVSVPWRVERGNFRSMESVSMGILEDNALVVGSGPDFLVPRGSVGLLRTSGTDLANSIMVLNEVFDLGGGDFVAITAADDITAIDPSLATGVDIQLVDSASNLTGNLLANRGIGVIRAVTDRKSTRLNSSHLVISYA